MSIIYGVKNKVKGRWKQVEGNVNQQAGRINHQPSKGFKGGLQKIEGKIQESIGNAELNAKKPRPRNRNTI